MYKHLNKLVNLLNFCIVTLRLLHYQRLITFPMPPGHCSQLVTLVLKLVQFFHQMNPQRFSKEADILRQLSLFFNSWFISYHSCGSRMNP